VKLFIAPAALAELQAAAAFYVSSANVQLGRAFLAELQPHLSGYWKIRK
jgi:hypothetical protein